LPADNRCGAQAISLFAAFAAVAAE
jgi:hypothetical protein